MEPDDYGFFSFRDDIFGLPDLTVLREMIRSGDIWNIIDVCNHFRFLVACFWSIIRIGSYLVLQSVPSRRRTCDSTISGASGGSARQWRGVGENETNLSRRLSMSDQN
jgi:hypothetical protein